MKRTYIVPTMEIANIGRCTVLAGSGVSGGEGLGEDIDYGGEDEDGTIDPASRKKHDVWEDEDLDEEEEL